MAYGRKSLAYCLLKKSSVCIISSQSNKYLNEKSLAIGKDIAYYDESDKIHALIKWEEFKKKYPLKLG